MDTFRFRLNLGKLKKKKSPGGEMEVSFLHVNVVKNRKHQVSWQSWQGTDRP